MHLLSTLNPDFEQRFNRIVNDRREADSNVTGQVTSILADVRRSGDKALVDLTQRFDGYALGEDANWVVSKDRMAEAYGQIDDDLRDALELAAKRIRAYHEAQLPEDRDYLDETGVRLGAIWRPVDAAGLYVPGGRAAYPSSLLMNAIPARVAGVERVVVVTPTPKGNSNPVVLAAAHIAGIDEMWRVGGAQAIGALAYGTEKIKPVDVVTGPGNAYVAEAKRQLYGVVGIDMVAGPSEIVVIADGKNDPDWTAADLLSQAEHDPSSQSVLITDDAAFARQVEDSIDVLLATLETGKRARESWDTNGVIIIVNDIAEEAAHIANRLAAEHVELAIEDDLAEQLLKDIRHAGSVFIGRMTPEAVGDYVAGPNHVLPTGRRARFSSGLSVLDFMKRTSFLRLDQDSLNMIGPAAAKLAHAEGLPAHAKSVEVRLK